MQANDANQTSNTAPLRAERGGVSGPKMIPSTALRGEPGGAGERRAGDDPAARTASVHHELLWGSTRVRFTVELSLEMSNISKPVGVNQPTSAAETTSETTK